MNASPPSPRGRQPHTNPLTRTFRDSYVMAVRNLRRMIRTPQLVAFQAVQPVTFTLLLLYVFGGAIHTPGLRYVDYLLPGILVQATLFGGGTTTVGIAQDLSEGMVDRFRSLPMTRPAVLTGRTIADALKNTVVIGLLLAVGTAVGFRFHGPPLADVAALALVLAFAYAFSWVFAAIALLVRDPETAQVAGFLPIFPLVFASSAFVPTASMPHWLQPFAEHQPISVTVNATRALTQAGHTGTLALTSLAWTLGILLVAAPLATSRYRRLR